tara:strand:+ start:63 stop:494 length:432 start_codon:yes stop_codon:yes gene_type:complete
MGLNSTATAYNFGQFGSTYLSGNGSILDLRGATAKYYVCAITVVTITQLEELHILDGGVDLGMGNTHFISTEDTQTLDTDWGAVTNLGDNDGLVLGTGDGGDAVELPAGITLYGMWDYVELHSGDIICYVAPRPDYISRSASI